MIIAGNKKIAFMPFWMFDFEFIDDVLHQYAEEGFRLQKRGIFFWTFVAQKERRSLPLLCYSMYGENNSLDSTCIEYSDSKISIYYDDNYHARLTMKVTMDERLSFVADRTQKKFLPQWLFLLAALLLCSLNVIGDSLNDVANFLCTCIIFTAFSFILVLCFAFFYWKGRKANSKKQPYRLSLFYKIELFLFWLIIAELLGFIVISLL